MTPTISHYRLGSRLGAGGMGEVYLADDLALGRRAALKILPEGFSPDLRARLFREAEASARLQHPGIATFYEAGESNGVAFLAMEYVPGETLRSRLAGGSLGFSEAFAMTAVILEALTHAHAVGILHRDIKPENVMLTGEGSTKLLDFGLAKDFAADAVLPEGKTETALTEVGAMVGTIGYMSPEQLRGDPLDARSDLFAVGAILYEAVSGERAFPGRTAGERITAILSRDPSAVARVGTPAELQAILSKALARDAGQRYPSATAFLSDLRRVGSGEFVSTLPDTIALLDFENLSGNPDDNWIGSGIAESLAVDLARVSGVSVLSRERVLKARAACRSEPGPKIVEPIEVGLALGCRWLLSGGYQRAGPALRVTSRLIEVATGRVVSTEKIDGKLDEIFQMQDRLAAAAVASLNVTVPTPEPGPRSGPRLDAYECYARGRRLYFRLEKGSFDQARELYQQAVAIDPEYAPALAGIATVHALRFTFTTDRRDLETSIEFARRSIAKDPKVGDAYIWLGYSLMRQGLMDEAIEAQTRAMKLDPGNLYGPYFTACAHAFSGRHAVAIALFQRALEIEPKHGWSWLGLGMSHLELGHLQEGRWSLEQAAKVEQEQPEGGPTAGVSGYLGDCLRRAGDLAGARARCLEGLDAIEKSDHMYRDTMRAVCLCVLGRTALEQEDLAAARAAFHQAISHLRGRPRALGGGHLLVQALAGLARAGEGTELFEEALALFEGRAGLDFSTFWLCTDDVTLQELARAAAVLGRAAEAQSLASRAHEAGR